MNEARVPHFTGSWFIALSPWAQNFVPNSSSPICVWMSMSLGVPYLGYVASPWTLILYSWLLCEAPQWWMDVWESGDHNFGLPYLRLRSSIPWVVSRCFPNVQHLMAMAQGQWSQALPAFHLSSGASHIPAVGQNADPQKMRWQSSHKTFFYSKSLWYGHRRVSPAKMSNKHEELSSNPRKHIKLWSRSLVCF